MLQRKPYRQIAARKEVFDMLNDLLRVLEESYLEHPTESTLIALNKARRLKEVWWTEEVSHREHEINELFKNFHKFPHSVRVAALDEELQ